VKNLNEEIGRIKSLMGILTEDTEDKIAVLLDGTSSSGKSYTAQTLKAVPFYEATDPNQWVVIDSDHFSGVNNEGEERRLKLDTPDIRDWAKGKEYGIVSSIYRKDGKDVPKNPYEDEYIEGTDPRLWYMAQEFKTGPWKKVIFDDIGNDIRKYVPNIKHKILIHSPIYIMLSNVGERNKSDDKNHHRDPRTPLNQYLEKYESTTSKPDESIGDPTTEITKGGLKTLLMDKMVDTYPDYNEEYIDNFINDLGIKDDSTKYWIKVKDNYLSDNQVLINVGSNQQTYIDKIKEKIS